MKKLLFPMIVVVMMLCFSGCGSDDSSTAGDSATEPKVERDLPEGNYSDTGNGTMYIATPSGTSENGEIPVIYVQDDILSEQISLYAEDFDGSLISYIYVDGVQISKEQLSDSQITVDFQKTQLTEGKHEVEVVQYTDNDTKKDIVTYKSAKYEVKPME